MNFPDDLKYAKSHEWLRVDGSTGRVGISDFAQSELGDIVFVDITVSPGDDLAAGQVFGTIEAVKTVSDLYTPTAGTFLGMNPMISDSPETINRDPYGDGWMIEIEVEGSVNPDLMDAAAYGAMVGQAH